MAREWRRGAYLVTTDKGRLDLETIHGFLEISCWAAGIPADVVMRSVENSLTFGLFAHEEQVAFARVVTDYGHLRLPRRRLRPGAAPWAGLRQVDDGGRVLAPQTAGLEAMDSGNPGRARAVP